MQVEHLQQERLWEPRPKIANCLVVGAVSWGVEDPGSELCCKSGRRGIWTGVSHIARDCPKHLAVSYSRVGVLSLICHQIFWRVSVSSLCEGGKVLNIFTGWEKHFLSSSSPVSLTHSSAFSWAAKNHIVFILLPTERNQRGKFRKPTIPPPLLPQIASWHRKSFQLQEARQTMQWQFEAKW